MCKKYALPFFYTGMCVSFGNDYYEVLHSSYDSDDNKQNVYLKKLK